MSKVYPRRAGPALLVAAAAAAVALAACGSSSSTTATNVLPAKAQVARTSLGLGNPSPALCQGKQYTIGYDSFSDSQPFAVAVAQDLDSAAKQMGCVKLIKLVDNADPQTALANVRTLIEQKVNGVILFQILAAAQPAIARSLKQAGIPGVATAVPAPGMPFVSDSDYHAGFQAGQALARAFKAKHPSGASPYLIVGGRPEGGPVDKQRAQGIVDGVKSVLPALPQSQIQVIDSNALQDVAYTQTLSALSRVPAGKPVIMSGENEEVVAGMFRAAQQRGRKDLLVMGLGGDQTGMKLVCTQPQYVGTVQFFPERWGTWLLPAIIAQIQKTGLPATVYIPTAVQTKSDIQKTYPSFPCS
jgi:ABC-type sugar transport system substrate-binding protein